VGSAVRPDRGADGLDEPVRQRVFQQVACGTGLNRPIDVFVAAVHREHDDPRLRIFLADELDGARAAHLRQLQVHQHDVRTIALVQLHRLLASGGRANHLHVGLAVDLPRHAFADQRMVVNAQHSYD
jgi:hypothetical protein